MDNASISVFSLDQPDQDDGEETILDFCGGRDETRDKMRFKEEEQNKKIEQIMNEVLDDREKRILESRIGLPKYYGSQTLQEIGDDIGITREGVRKIQLVAIEKLRAHIEKFRPHFKENLDPYPDF